MLLKLKNVSLVENRQGLAALPEGKLLINTINAHSYNTAQKDRLFAEALQQGDVLIPVSSRRAVGWMQDPNPQSALPAGICSSSR